MNSSDDLPPPRPGRAKPVGFGSGAQASEANPDQTEAPTVPLPRPGKPKPADKLSQTIPDGVSQEEPATAEAPKPKLSRPKQTTVAPSKPIMGPEGSRRSPQPEASPAGDVDPELKACPGALAEQAGGAVEIVEVSSTGSVAAGAVATNSTNSTPGHRLEDAILPPDSLLWDYRVYAQAHTESADSYIGGAFLPVVAAMLARHVYFLWGDERIYSNLFVMLAGKSGDRKSTAINLAESLSKAVLKPQHFLPHNCSAESLFEEYCPDAGGSPDKILIADDANPILGTWTKSGYGERVGQRFLNLFDCKSLSESFERNKRKRTDAGRRSIPETCTSVVLGGTFDICRLTGRGISSGLQRRFLFYAAERHGRFIACPPPCNQSEFDRLVQMLAKLGEVRAECRFSDPAMNRWEAYQRENRVLLHHENNEAQAARLNGAPRHAQKVAMLFEAAMWAKRDDPVWDGIIHLSTLDLAIAHVEHCLATAARLDSIADRASITASADILLAKIRRDFGHCGPIINGWIRLTKTDLTAKYAHHSSRSGAWTPIDLYDRFIPNLIERSLARFVGQQGKKVWYEFPVED
jgi:hypothetical protein